MNTSFIAIALDQSGRLNIENADSNTAPLNNPLHAVSRSQTPLESLNR
jgi:hypothetical protein